MKVFQQYSAEWFPGINIRVAVGTKRCNKVMRKCGFENVSNACAITCHKEGDDYCLVCLSDGWVNEKSKDQKMAVVAHEAVHCTQSWLKELGEDCPGDEEYAYMVQACVLSILEGIKAERRKGRGLKIGG